MAKLKGDRTKAGAVISTRVIDALAEEAARGYDLSRAKRRRVGRPSLAGSGPSPRMTFRATPELYAAIHDLADIEERSVSDIAREAVEGYVRSRPSRAG